MARGIYNSALYSPPQTLSGHVLSSFTGFGASGFRYRISLRILNSGPRMQGGFSDKGFGACHLKTLNILNKILVPS